MLQCTLGDVSTHVLFSVLKAVSNVAMELENPFEGKYHSIPLDYHLARWVYKELFAFRMATMQCECLLRFGGCMSFVCFYCELCRPIPITF